jgi:general secretion pathway protein G
MRQGIKLRQVALLAQSGMTLLELIMACSILLVLATAALPVARFTVLRQKETELRRSLREMRDAIDRYKDASDRNLIRVAAGTEGYPPDLETLVTGVEIVSQAGSGPGATVGQPTFGATGGGPPSSLFSGFSGDAEDAVRRVRFLRKIPVDPITNRAEWGLRSVQDDPDSRSWGGGNVFDVYSLAISNAMDGSRYSDW